MKGILKYFFKGKRINNNKVTNVNSIKNHIIDKSIKTDKPINENTIVINENKEEEYAPKESEMIFGTVLGCGAHSTVYIATDSSKNKYVCKKMKKSHRSNALREIFILKKLKDNKYFPNYKFHIETKYNFMIFTEYNKAIDLFEFVNRLIDNGTLTDDIIKDGIRIVNMDKSHTTLVHLSLDADKFEHYYCKYPKIVVGVNMMHLFKLINTIDNDDTLTLYIAEENFSSGIVDKLGLRFENGDINQTKDQKLKLIEPEEEEMEIPNVDFSSIITFPSTDFQKIIRDLSSISERLEIKSVGNELIFKCCGPFAEGEIRRGESDSVTEFIKNPDASKIIQGEFSLKNLGYFIKCTNLCNSIEIFLENDLPLIVKYAVASLGTIKLCLAPLPQLSN